MKHNQVLTNDPQSLMKTKNVNAFSTPKRLKKYGEREEKFYELIQDPGKVEGIERCRISSIEPNLLLNKIIEFVF